MRVDQESRYTRTHEYVRMDGDEALTGVTDYAQEQLSDIVYIEFPEPGEHFDKGESWGVVESVKAASDCYMPVAGTVVAVNEELNDNPGLVNEDPYQAWLVRFTPDDPADLDELMDPDTYAGYAASQEGAH